MSGYAKVSSKGQITLSAAVRKHLSIKPGMYLSIVEDGEGIYITPLKDDLSSLKGAIAVDGPQDYKAARHKAMEDVACEKAKAD